MKDGNITFPAWQSFNGTWTAIPLLLVICSALATYNAIEGIVMIFSTFRKYHGLYFWSLVVAFAGIPPYMIGLIIWYFQFTHVWIGLIFENLGWVAMVTGQSVVLYSRLGVVLGQHRANILRAVKWMIIIDAVVLHTATITISTCSIYAPNPIPAAHAYHYIERIQMTIFSVQELIISFLYIWGTLDTLRTCVKSHTRRIMAELLAINFIIIAMDIALLALEYRDMFFAEASFKMVAYSIKLKLEFAILSKLVEVSTSGRPKPVTRMGDTANLQEDILGTDKDQSRTGSLSQPVQPVAMEKPSVETVENSDSSTDQLESPDSLPVHLRHTHATPVVQHKDPELNYAEIMKEISHG